MGGQAVRTVLISALWAVALASLAGCTGPGSGDGPDGDATTTPSPTAEGPAPVAPGEEVTTAIDGYALRFAVDSVTVTGTCPGRGTPEQVPSHEVFVVLDVRAALEGTDPPGTDASTRGEVVVPLGAEVFRIAAPDGTVQEVTSTDASWACYDAADLAPPFVGPGEEAAGLVVLDSESGHGAVIFAPAGEPGWEWVF